MKININILALLVVGSLFAVSPVAMGVADTGWLTDANGSITDTGNWTDGLPIDGYEGDLNSGEATGSGTDFDTMEIYMYGTGRIMMGTSTVKDFRLTVEGGEVQVDGDLILQQNSSFGVMYNSTMSATLMGNGNLTLGKDGVDITQQGGAVLFVDGALQLMGETTTAYTLKNGVVHVKDIEFGASGGFFNFGGSANDDAPIAMLKVAWTADKEDELRQNIVDGNIQMFGVVYAEDDIDDHYTITNDGANYITIQAVIPEPAVIGLISIFGGGMLACHRIFGKK